MSYWNLERDIATSVSALTGAKPHIVQNMMYMIYLERLHEAAMRALSADSKLDEIDMFIPHIGVLYFSNKNGTPEFSRIELSEDFLNDLNNAINKGESKLDERLNAKLIQTLNNTYKELL